MKDRYKIKDLFREISVLTPDKFHKLIDGLWREPLWLYFENRPGYEHTDLVTGPGADPRYIYTKNLFVNPDSGITTPWASAMGFGNLVLGHFARVLGYGNLVGSMYQTTIGPYGLIPEDLDLGQGEWREKDFLFVLANGSQPAARSHAWEVFKSGYFRLLNAIVVGAYNHNDGGNPIVPRNGTIQFTNANKFQGWYNEMWNRFLTEADLDGYLRLNQSTPQNIINGIPKLESNRLITHPNQLVDKTYVDQSTPTVGVDYYLLQAADAGIAAYKATTKTPSSEATENTTTVEAVNDQLLAQWITADSPGSLPAGKYSLLIDAARTAGENTARLYWSMYAVDDQEAETLIATSSTGDELTTKSRHTISLVLPNRVELAEGSRVAIKVRANVVGAETDPTIVLYYEGAEQSRAAFPISNENISGDYVPYSGASKNVDLGSKTISTAAITAGGIAYPSSPPSEGAGWKAIIVNPEGETAYGSIPSPAPDKFITLTDTPASYPATNRGQMVRQGGASDVDFADKIGQDANGPWFATGSSRSEGDNILSGGSANMVADTWYRITFTISGMTEGSAWLEIDGVPTGEAVTENGTYDRFFQASVTRAHTVDAVGDVDFDGTATAVQVLPVTYNVGNSIRVVDADHSDLTEVQAFRNVEGDAIVSVGGFNINITKQAVGVGSLPNENYRIFAAKTNGDAVFGYAKNGYGGHFNTANIGNLYIMGVLAIDQSGRFRPSHDSNANAPNNSLFRDIATGTKLLYKDVNGTVHDLTATGGGVPGTETLSGASVTLNWNGTTTAIYAMGAPSTLTIGSTANYVKRVKVTGNYALTISGATVASGSYSGSKINLIDFVPVDGVVYAFITNI